MNKEIVISPPTGFIVDESRSTFSKIVFKAVEKSLLERIETFKDILKELGTTPKEHRNKYSNLDSQQYAAIQIEEIAKVLNQGWKPDWKNTNEYKYYIWWNMESNVLNDVYYFCWGSRIGGRSVFKERKLVEFAADKFKDIFSTYFVG